MGIDLSKGARVNLEKEAPGLKNIKIGLGWNPNATDTGGDFDLDASVFMIDSSGKTPTSKYFVFYNNNTSEDGSTVHEGDNKTGEGDGDDEVVSVDLEKISDTVTEIIFVVTIHDSEERKQNFGQVPSSFIRIFDGSTEIAKYELDEDFSTETAVEFGKLYKKDGSWRFQAVGNGYNGGLQSFVDKYYKD